MALILSELNQNSNVRENTYFTLMLIAFEKRKVHDLPYHAIPKIDDIVMLIHTTKLRKDKVEQEFGQPKQTNFAFDIDFFFVLAEQFRKFNVFTRRIFLLHLIKFLRSHQTAFMQIFDEVGSNENSFKKKLLGFFFMIIQDCMTSADIEISRSAENILLEVCTFQLMSPQVEPGSLQPSFGSQQMNSFVSADTRLLDKKVCRLEASDFDGHKLLMQILMFFKNDNNQFKILLRLVFNLFTASKTWEDSND
jgi:hypothetical protein